MPPALLRAGLQSGQQGRQSGPVGCERRAGPGVASHRIYWRKGRYVTVAAAALSPWRSGHHSSQMPSPPRHRLDPNGVILDCLDVSNVLDGDLCGLALALVKDVAPKLDDAVADNRIEVSWRPCFVYSTRT
jgi:hypothetical protein